MAAHLPENHRASVMIDSVNIEGSINAQNRYNIGGIIGYATGEPLH